MCSLSLPLFLSHIYTCKNTWKQNSKSIGKCIASAPSSVMAVVHCNQFITVGCGNLIYSHHSQQRKKILGTHKTVDSAKSTAGAVHQLLYRDGGNIVIKMHSGATLFQPLNCSFLRKYTVASVQPVFAVVSRRKKWTESILVCTVLVK